MGLVLSGGGPEQNAVAGRAGRIIVVDIRFPVNWIGGAVEITGSDGEFRRRDGLGCGVRRTIYVGQHLPVGVGSSGHIARRIVGAGGHGDLAAPGGGRLGAPIHADVYR